VTQITCLSDASAYRAAPFEVQVDALEASRLVELAIYAGDAATAAGYLSQAAQWVTWARDLLVTSGEQALADYATCAATQLTVWAGSSSSWGDLATFQQTQLRPFQGTLRGLYETAIVEEGEPGANEFLAVLALFATVLVGQRLEEWRPGRFAYGRPAR